jgi:hypothetical protein
MGWWNRSSDELETMRYLYDMAPYAMVYSRNHWVQALVTANSGEGGKILTGIINTKPLELARREWIHYSSKCIPFELEGIMTTVTVEQLLESIKLHRREDRLYSIGESDAPESVVMTLMLSNFRKDIPIEQVAEFARELWEEGKSYQRNVIYKNPEYNIDDMVEAAYYHGNAQERLKIATEFKMTDRQVEILNMKVMLGTRDTWYRFKLMEEGRENLAEIKKSHDEEEKRLVREFSDKYGIYVHVPETISTEVGDGIFGDDVSEPEGLFDFMLDEVEDIDELQVTGMNPSDNQLREFTMENADWVTRQENATSLARMVWDPGGSSMTI